MLTYADVCWHMLAYADRIARAQGLLDEMRELGMSDVLAYNALMAGLAKSKQWREILGTRFACFPGTKVQILAFWCVALRQQWREILGVNRFVLLY